VLALSVLFHQKAENVSTQILPNRARPLCTLPPEGREREYNYFLLKRVSNFRESEYSDPYICLTDPDAFPGGPKTYGFGCGSGTLLKVIKKSKTVKKPSKI
jgi:hypothetical protein